MQITTHNKFKEKFGGRVFIIYSIKAENVKKIQNNEIVDEIKKEIEKLRKK